MQNTKCKTTLAKTTIEQTTIEKQQSLKKKIEPLRGTPPQKRAFFKTVRNLIETQIRGTSPPRESNGIASKTIKNPYRLRLPLGNKKVKKKRKKEHSEIAYASEDPAV